MSDRNRQIGYVSIKQVVLFLWAGLFCLMGHFCHGETEFRSSTVVIIGNSITAGYGLSQQEAYPAWIEKKIESENLNVNVVNAGLSGDTSAGGLRRVNWLLRGQIDVLVLALGANDALRGLDPETTGSNLQAIIDKVKAKYPDVVIILAGMQTPPNMGNEYQRKFNAIYPDLAEKNKVLLVPFLLEGVAAIPSLNQADGIHPTAEGQKIVADNVWNVLAPVLKK